MKRRPYLTVAVARGLLTVASLAEADIEAGAGNYLSRRERADIDKALRWIGRICRWMRDNGDPRWLVNRDPFDEGQAHWRTAADPVASFVADCCNRERVDSVALHWPTATVLYDEFRDWAQRTGHKVPSIHTFSKRLRAAGVEKKASAGMRYKLRLRPRAAWQTQLGEGEGAREDERARGPEGGAGGIDS